MSFKGKIGKKFRPGQNQERTHDRTNVATLGDVRDLLPPLSPAHQSCWREGFHKVSNMCHTYFATKIIFTSREAAGQQLT